MKLSGLKLAIVGLLVMLAAALAKRYTSIEPTILLAAFLGGFVCLVIGAARPPRKPDDEPEKGSIAEHYERRERQDQDEIDRSRDRGDY